MRLATTGLLPADLRRLDDEAARRLRAAGFVGCSCFFPDPTAPTPAELDQLRDTLLRAGVGVAQVNGRYETLVNPDEGLRRQGIATLQAAVQVCRRLRGDNLYVRPGSLNPGGHWWPHPENHSPATLDRLVDSLRQVATVAEDAGVTLAVEGHTVSPLDTPALVREVIDRVGSPALKFNCDPVNFVSNVQDVYHSRRVLDALFDTLGDVTWAVHAKDMVLEDRHVRVNVICPGSINTELKLGVVEADARRQGRSVEMALAEAQEQLGDPEGVARVIAFLASDEADYVRGTLFTR